jgi:LCP family protein required for cell wall assembly
MQSDKKQNKAKKKRLFRKLLIVILSFAVIMAGAAILFLGAVTPPEIPTLPITRDAAVEYDDEEIALELDMLESGLVAPARFTDADRKEQFFTFLIVGLNEGTNANTIMVASFDAQKNEAHLVSIPRDSLMNTNRVGRKLSSSFMAGAGGGRGVAGGVAQMQRDVMSVIGFVPDFYMIIDYDAFFSIVDAVGGIEVYVPFHMRYTDRFQDLDIDILPGLQQMDAETALHFARFRQSNTGFRSINDYQRIEHQQIVVNEVLERLMRPANILRLPDFVNIFNESVHTNLSVGNMLWFANQLNNIRGTDALSTHTVPIAGTSGSPMYYELLDAPGIVSLVNDTINPFSQEIERRDLNITHT